MRTFLVAALLAVPLAVAAASPSSVQVTVEWEYRNFDSVVEVFEISGRPRLLETRSVRDLGDAPLAAPIEGASFALSPGQRKRFAVVVRNDSPQPVYFFAAPHDVRPAEHALGFAVKCLCINRAFAVGPAETWYRIVEVRLARDFEGDALTLTHSVIGIDRRRAEAFSRSAGLPDF